MSVIALALVRIPLPAPAKWLAQRPRAGPGKGWKAMSGRGSAHAGSARRADRVQSEDPLSIVLSYGSMAAGRPLKPAR